MAQNRINKPVTVTLSPEALEGIEILKEELGIQKASQVIDRAIKDALVLRGYTPLEKEK